MTHITRSRKQTANRMLSKLIKRWSEYLPIFNCESRYSGKFGHIVSHERETLSHGNRGNQQIIGANRHANVDKMSANDRIFFGGRIVKWQRYEPATERVHFC